MGTTYLRRTVLLAATALAAAGVITTPAGADPVPGDWVANARASAADISAVTTGGFIVDKFDPAGALAVSHLETGTQVATSLASAPYPSEIGQQFPGLLYGVLQNTLPYNGIPVPALQEAPAWPFTIRSSANGSDPTKASAGGETSPMWLKTESNERSTAGHAAIGGSGPGGFAMMRMTADSGTDATKPSAAVVKAVSTIENFAIGDVLKIGKIRTELLMTQASGARPEVKVNREIVGLTINGQGAKMGPEGLPQQMTDALKAAGIELRAGEQKTTAGGVSVSGLVIRRPFDFSQMSGGNLPLSVPKTMVFEMAFGVVTGNITDLDDQASSSPPMQLASYSTPATGAKDKKELGPLGWVAEVSAITVVLALVIRRGRRVVGGA
jgi:hypothetical protein